MTYALRLGGAYQWIEAKALAIEKTELARQGIDASSVLTFLGLLNPSPTKWRLSTVAGELLRIWNQYPWFKTARLDAKFFGSAQGLATIAGHPDWNEPPPTSPTGSRQGQAGCPILHGAGDGLQWRQVRINADSDQFGTAV